MNSAIPSELIRVLEDPKIIKLGVGISGDAIKLRKDFSIETRGCIDFNDIAPRANNAKVSRGLSWSFNGFFPVSVSGRRRGGERSYFFFPLAQTLF